MATETENSAAGNAITIPAATLAPCFAPENLMQYHLMLSLMDNLRHDDTSGLRYLILTSYVKCPKDRFKSKFGETAEHWKTVEPKGYKGCLVGVDSFVMEECPELIRITRADYVRNDFKVSLYHFLVHIVGNEDDTSSTPVTQA